MTNSFFTQKVITTDKRNVNRETQTYTKLFQIIMRSWTLM